MKIKTLIGIICTMLIILLMALGSCSKPCDDQLEQLHQDYIRALQNSSGNPGAAEEIKRQYEQRKANLDC
jgi:hypothetical protein